MKQATENVLFLTQASSILKNKVQNLKLKLTFILNQIGKTEKRFTKWWCYQDRRLIDIFDVLQFLEQNICFGDSAGRDFVEAKLK